MTAQTERQSKSRRLSVKTNDDIKREYLKTAAERRTTGDLQAGQRKRPFRSAFQIRFSVGFFGQACACLAGRASATHLYQDKRTS